MIDAFGMTRGLAGAWVCLTLCACGALPPAQPPASEDNPVPAAAAASAAAEAVYRLEVEAPGDLRTLLTTYLDLARFQSTAQVDRITPIELNRLANAAPAQARSLLETEGYFSSDVTVERATADDGVPLIRLRVSPGPRSTVTSLELKAGGELQHKIDAGDKDAIALLKLINERWSLSPGEPFRQAAWNAAKNGALATMRAEGYPTATWSSTQARVDARARTVNLSGQLESGPQFLIGELKIEGLQRYDESVVRNIANLPPGSPYSERRLLDFQDRLTKLGFFETVSVEIDPDPATAAATPVRVRVREQTLQQATTGFGYSDTTRLRVTLEYRHRRPFGWNGQIYNKLELGGLLRSWEGDLISNPDPNRYRKLLAVSLKREEAAGEILLTNRVRLGRSLDSERIERLAYGEWIRSKLTRANGDKEDNRAVSLNYKWVWRDLDSIVLPTKGRTFTLETGAGFARSDTASNGPFARLYTRNTLYWPIARNWYSQFRVEAGQVFANNEVGIPDPLLFRAGGDESVRGYAFRTLGPIRDGAVSSGRVLLTTSAEIAHPFTQRLPSLWWAAFVDAGNAADDWGALDPAVGYGLGLRYRSPVGPLRLDLAYGQEVKKVRLHLSVGFAF